MKRYRVYYAGKPDDAVSLLADSPREAAFLFFSNAPEATTLFVEGKTFFSNKNISYNELLQLHPEAASILETFNGETGVIQKSLEQNHQLKPAKDEPLSFSSGYFKLKLIGLGIGLLLAGIVGVVNESVKSEPQTLNYKEFSMTIPGNWEIVRESENNESGYMIIFRCADTVLFLYFYPRPNTISPQSLMEYHTTSYLPEMGENATIKLGEFVEKNIFGYAGAIRPMEYTKNSKTENVSWYTLAIDKDRYGAYIFMQYPDSLIKYNRSVLPSILKSIKEHPVDFQKSQEE